MPTGFSHPLGQTNSTPPKDGAMPNATRKDLAVAETNEPVVLNGREKIALGLIALWLIAQANSVINGNLNFTTVMCLLVIVYAYVSERYEERFIQKFVEDSDAEYEQLIRETMKS
jgi:hypothetical protein